VLYVLSEIDSGLISVSLKTDKKTLKKTSLPTDTVVIARLPKQYGIQRRMMRSGVIASARSPGLLLPNACNPSAAPSMDEGMPI
jgi:hypothetical protein